MSLRPAFTAGLLLAVSAFGASDLAVAPGVRVLMDAHNCYPYDGRWADRIDRALSAGTPLAIEQDLFWYTDKAAGKSRSLVTHGKPVNGLEPSMREYFFERIRPIMENALRDGNHGDWPLITLNLDFKTDEAEHHAAVWKLLGEYEGWLCTAERSADPKEVTPIHAGPLLVLSGEQESQERDFHDILPAGAKLRVFGAVPVRHTKPSQTYAVPPADLVPVGATNYRRWWNNPWLVVEKGGQRHAGNWTAADNQRLKELVNYAHSHGLWMRFYTLNGGPAELDKKNGQEPDYNFGSGEAARLRWKAAAEAGVDYIATDQYEELGAFLNGLTRRAPDSARGPISPCPFDFYLGPETSQAAAEEKPNEENDENHSSDSNTSAVAVAAVAEETTTEQKYQQDNKNQHFVEFLSPFLIRSRAMGPVEQGKCFR